MTNFVDGAIKELRQALVSAYQHVPYARFHGLGNTILNLTIQVETERAAIIGHGYMVPLT